MFATATSAAPLACVAAASDGAARRRKDARLAAVLSEFGYRSMCVNGEDEVWLAADAKLVVCDLVNPADDLPIEVALAATRGNQIKAADLLGLNRNTLRKKIRELGVSVYRSSRNA